MSTRVDLTAMVDLAFLLVTFFMLTTSLNKSQRFNLTMPANEGGDAVPASRTLTLCLGSGHQVVSYLGTDDAPIIKPHVSDFSKKGLRKTIIDTKQRIFEQSGKNMMVLLKPSDKSVYGDMVNALDELKINGVDTYAIVKISPKDIGFLKEKAAF